MLRDKERWWHDKSSGIDALQFLSIFGLNSIMAVFSGIPAELIKVLETLPCEGLQPTWSLRHRNGSFSVLITWQPKTPAISVSADRQTRPDKEHSVVAEAVDSCRVVRPDNQLTNPNPATTTGKPDRTGKKRKSPSARRRDRQRLLAWKAKRQSSASAKAAAEPVVPRPFPAVEPAVATTSSSDISEPKPSPSPVVKPPMHKAQSKDKVGEHYGLDFYAVTGSDDDT